MRNDQRSPVGTCLRRFRATPRAPGPFAIQTSFAGVRDRRFFAALRMTREGNPSHPSPLSPLGSASDDHAGSASAPGPVVSLSTLSLSM